MENPPAIHTPKPDDAPMLVVKPASKRRSKLEIALMSLFFFSLFCLFSLFFVFMRYGVNLPDYNQLADYKPPITSRFYAGDGSLLTEYATEQRIFVPLREIPPNLVNAFISAEDKNFWSHSGIDIVGIIRAIITNIHNKLTGSRRIVGGSTITQQVAKNFFLTAEQSFTRKIKEIILALKMERAFSKRHILTLYMNQIFLGYRSYGVAAASLNYFNKSLEELTLAESAFLAAVPKGPSNYNPVTNKDRAIMRRNWVIDRMREDGYISGEEAERAKAEDIEVSESFISKQQRYSLYFSEEVRKILSGIYGEEQLYSGGLAVRTTIEPRYQEIATRVLRKALISFDRKRGWRGAETNINLDDPAWLSDPATLKQMTDGDKELWEVLLPKVAIISGMEDDGWKKAIVLSVSEGAAEIGVLRAGKGTIPLFDLAWAKRLKDDVPDGAAIKSAGQVLAKGDVVFVQKAEGEGNAYSLRQVPELNGAMIVMDPHTGRIFAMVGGFSYARSKFNRAVQAYRQPGSTIKPFVYLTALEKGNFTPSSVLLDAPVVLEKSDGEMWRPENYDNVFAGEITFRRAIEKSKNNPAVRVALDVGVRNFVNTAVKFGVYRNVKDPNLSMALGSGDTTLVDLTSAFAKLINGGRKIEAVLIDRVQDRNGKTVFNTDKRECRDCSLQEWSDGLLPPEIPDDREQLADPVSIYQIVHILEGAVERGSGWMARIPGKTIGGKTGTSNEQKDVWFIGGTPDLVAGVFLGYDHPKSLGDYAAGGALAAPIFREFMEQVLKNRKDVAFRVPEGVTFVRVNRETGKLATPKDRNFDVVLEAFREGTENTLVDDAAREAPSGGGTYNFGDAEENNKTNFDGIY
ncbi:MAG: penicillin-binding protein 1A [Rickettsiales bacterium]|nr:penicillin-binding protein 1A [Rickettsiales bacterium]